MGHYHRDLVLTVIPCNDIVGGKAFGKIIAEPYRRIARRVLRPTANRQHLDIGIDVEMEEERDRISLALDGHGCNAMGRRDETTIGPAGQCIANVDDECAWHA